ncbi:cation/H(+) antiporter [Flavobacterium branchiophilum]|uniref:Transporter (CPA2 family) n=1 Tax=Flavobacterium branchiophilum TaxID=55197 RepID=A0A543G3T5_9FLAO|nr:cation:proton antiporter [Flavobacterium branchiophilum]OXA82190.1 cation/H(+) antiporter [Flavobacterium branchiophilum] [Flavobacterium branchiophilum NBRC 15030 = ATCC 35035]TQM40749.1 transporter (CPA2 family) [Flavobacterium branchiophilum]GEM55409.1 cation/H(+) antiporter [Flavobacterium branchiophilum NBRC 15030 = ATCC 35035]
MKNYRNTIFYLIITGGFSALMYWILTKGKSLEIGKFSASTNTTNDYWNDFMASMQHNLHHPLAILLVQIITIILVSRFFGWIFRKIGQPSVIGEIIAGIFLGPSLVGMYFPEYSAALFPTESLGNLQFLSQIGLILFMFVIGMELDLKILKNKANDAIVISHASIVIPFTLGIALAYFVYYQFAPKGVAFLSFALFMGISMSITAFPVLARIVQERGIHKTKLGAIVITCAAADDITAWCLLAAVIAIVKAGSVLSSIYVMGLAFGYVLAMLFLVKPFLKKIGELYGDKEKLTKPVVAIFFLTLIMSAYATEVIGIHALFGAFMSGVIMPDIAKFRNIFIEKVEDVSLILLLPLFFVFTGLRTQIGLINDVYLWKVTGFIILVAVVGKFLGSALAAKFVGQSWRDSLTIGALMNTRGLMELVVLNIGLDLKVLTPEVFTMMVIMALLTTFMTGPALNLINYIFNTKDVDEDEEIINTSDFRILLSFGNNEKGKSLLKLANCLIKKQPETSKITAMHLTPSDEMHAFNLEEVEKEKFGPLLEQSKVLKQKLTTIFKATTDIETNIAEVANNGEYDLLLIGLGKSIFEGTFLGKVLGFTTRLINPDRLLDKFKGKEGLFENSPFDERTRQIISKTKTPIGILIDNDLQDVQKVFLPILSQEDTFLIDYAQKLIFNNQSQITISDSHKIVKTNFVLQSAISSLEEKYPDHLDINNNKEIPKELLAHHDIVLISLESWKNLIDAQSNWLSNIPSVLIIKP